MPPPALGKTRRTPDIEPARGLVIGRQVRPVPPRRIGFVPADPLPADAVPADAHDQPLISYQGDAHLLTFASTGSGKSTGPVCVNALTHPGQLVSIDPKGDVYRITAERRRAMGQPVHVLDLRDEAQVAGSLNPMDLAARCGTEPAAVARALAVEMVDRGVAERDRFWSDWAETMITGGLAWTLADCPADERKLSCLFDLFTGDDVPYAIACLLDAGRVHDRAARAAFAGFLQLPDRETRPSVLASTTQHLRLWDSQLVRRLTDTTSIDLDAFIAGEPMSIYIIPPAYRIAALRPLLRLWLSGLLYALMRRTTVPEHRTLFLCDEIASLGRMDAFVTATTLMRGFGVTLWSFWQNPAQLEVYGPDARTLVDNAGVLQVFGVRNWRSAEEFAALVGGVDAAGIMALRPDEQLLMIEGAPVWSRCVRYFDAPELQAGRLDVASGPARARSKAR